MTKEITKAVILQELQDKLKLREFEPANFLFEETVIPTYEIAPHLLHGRISQANVSITSAAAFLFFTVPDNEKWRFSRYDIIFMGSGAITVAGVYIQRKNSGIYFAYLDLEAGQTVSYHTELPTPVVLWPGDTIHVTVDGYTSSQYLRMYLDYEREEIR